MNSTFKKIIGIFTIAFVALITIRYVKLMPIMLKLLALAANAITIYLVISWIRKKKVKEDDVEVIDIEAEEVDEK